MWVRLMDDPTIGDDEKVIRRVFGGPHPFDANSDRIRPSTQAFLQDGKDGLVSVYLLAETTPDAVAQEGEQPYQCVVSAGILRENGLGIIRTPDKGGPGHCDITGRKTKSRLTNIVRAAQWVEGYSPLDPPSVSP